MKVLVIGGSYFAGRVFLMSAAKDYEITVVNRGTYSVEALGVKQVVGDRHLAQTWKKCEEDYDAVVDFCAYEPGDVSTVLENIAGSIKQYILISTVDVYERGIENQAGGPEHPRDRRKGENTALETRTFPGEAGRYIAGKVTLEQEAKHCCEGRDIPLTILRPAIIYGPFNYAPRESVWIRLMVQNKLLPRITNADGRFQLVYVKDVAQAIIRCIGNQAAFGEAFNLCGQEICGYEEFEAVLLEAAESVEESEGEKLQLSVVELSPEEAQDRGIPMAFPTRLEDTELVDNWKSQELLGLQYTSLAEGMKRTYRAFRSVYYPD